MKSCMNCHLHLLLVTAVVLLGARVNAGIDTEEIERTSKSGETLSAAVAKDFPLREQRVCDDTGINVVTAFQADPKAQRYLPEEVAALDKYVREGGGLVLLGSSVRDGTRLAEWPLNNLAGEFGAAFTSEVEGLVGVADPSLRSGLQHRARINHNPYQPLGSALARRKHLVGFLFSVGSCAWRLAGLT